MTVRFAALAASRLQRWDDAVRILEKMAVATNAELVRYAARYGLIG